MINLKNKIRLEALMSSESLLIAQKVLILSWQAKILKRAAQKKVQISYLFLLHSLLKLVLWIIFLITVI